MHSATRAHSLAPAPTGLRLSHASPSPPLSPSTLALTPTAHLPPAPLRCASCQGYLKDIAEPSRDQGARKRDQEAARSNRSECPSYRSKKKGCAPRRRRLGRHLGGALRQRGLGRRLGGALRQRHLGWCHLCAARVSVPPPGAALSVGVAPMRRVGTAWGGASAARCVSAASSVSWLVVVVSFITFSPHLFSQKYYDCGRRLTAC